MDVQKIFASKTSSQLLEMHKGIQAKLKKGGPIDVSYWENVGQQVRLAGHLNTSLLDTNYQDTYMLVPNLYFLV